MISILSAFLVTLLQLAWRDWKYYKDRQRFIGIDMARREEPRISNASDLRIEDYSSLLGYWTARLVRDQELILSEGYEVASVDIETMDVSGGDTGIITLACSNGATFRYRIPHSLSISGDNRLYQAFEQSILIEANRVYRANRVTLG